MFLYTVAKPEMIFPPAEVEYTEMWLNSRHLSVANIGGRKVVSRLISTNPKDYLNPNYMPGRELD